MDKTLQAINRISAIAAVAGDTQVSQHLPKIVVLGGQSSGKSSVLESIVGRDFLPRGTGIVTRRPLELQLETADEASAFVQDYGVFSHLPGTKFFNFEEIRNEIQAETARHIEEKGVAVSHEPIYLRIVSPNLAPLSLVDLPGLTRVIMDGQPDGIVKDLENMAREYIRHKNVIILAVSPANADLATSEALRLAKEVDLERQRTIGLMTKLDLMDPGTNCREILENKALKLKHGWLGVVNRGQLDIENNMSMEEARAREMDFFHNQANMDYVGLKNIGTEYLSNHLSEMLIASVKRQLPYIKAKIMQGIKDMEKELESMGGPAVTEKGEMRSMILDIARDFQKEFIRIVDRGVHGGEDLLNVFKSRLPEAISKQPFQTVLEYNHVVAVLKRNCGYKDYMLAPEDGCNELLRELLALLNTPCQGSVKESHELLSQMVDQVSVSKDLILLKRFPTLSKEIIIAAGSALAAASKKTAEWVSILIEMEQNYIPAEYFRVVETGKMPDGKVLYTLDGRPVTEEIDGDDKEEVKIKRIINQISGYVREVNGNMIHTVPKAIVQCMVIEAKKNLLAAFHHTIATCDSEAVLKRLLEEDEEMARKRNATAHKLDEFKRAQEMLSTEMADDE